MIDSNNTKVNDGRFSRTELMLGQEGCEKLRNSLVMVVGLGAVGSYAVEGLARAGVGKLRLVDFDKVCPSNINRQLYALDSTLGKLKSDVARERVLEINPACQVETVNCFVGGENVHELLVNPPDIVIDAIDGLNPKTQLMEAVREAKIPLISSLGAALRYDPTRIRVGTLEEARGCPLGKSVKRFLKRRGVPMDFLCVYSDEPLPKPLPILAPGLDSPDESAPIKRGRERNTLGSLPTITGIFGLTAANLAIGMLTGRVPIPEYAVEQDELMADFSSN